MALPILRYDGSYVAPSPVSVPDSFTGPVAGRKTVSSYTGTTNRMGTIASSGATTKKRKTRYSSILPGLSAAELAQAQQQRGESYRNLRDQLAAIRNTLTGTSMGVQSGLREAARSAVGQAQDLGSGLSELGYAFSPAQYQGGLASIAAQEAATKAGISSDWARALSQQTTDTLSAQNAYSDALARIADMVAQQRIARSMSNLQNVMK